jgi:long-chain acyl-CoA synthetase
MKSSPQEPVQSDPRSLGDVFRQITAKIPDQTAMLIPTNTGGGGYESLSYQNLREVVQRYAATLHFLGFVKGDRLGIFSENCAEWAFLDWACQCLGVIPVPVYASLPGDQAEVILNDAGVKLTFVGAEMQARIPNMPTMPLRGDGSLDQISKSHEVDIARWNAAIDAIEPEDVCTIIYTSGTTGVPKGVMLPHRAALHVIQVVPKEIRLGPGDTFFSFLPMSHVYERVAGQFLPIGTGGTVAYARSLASIGADMQKVKPTVMLCVPRFLESFRDRVTDNVRKASPIRQRLFQIALNQGIKKAKGGVAPLHSLLDRIVMSTVRERTGGRMRFFVSGGAALSPDVAEFYMALGLTILQGYGLTETAGASIVNRPDRNRYWTVGEPLDMEVRLAEDGEVLLRGAGIMLGYYNRPEETSQVLDGDGWFRTGDIGVFEGESLRITDRKKDIIVLANGKNVAPQPLENRLKESPFITEAVVFGDELEFCIGLIVPNATNVRRELGLDDSVPLATREDVRKLIKREVDAANKKGAAYEKVKRFALLENPFTLDSGELTPTFKVKRKYVREKYAEILNEISR